MLARGDVAGTISGMVDALPRAAGSYGLLLAAPALANLAVGRRRYTLSPGLYVYVGSALGPGGLAARVGRHRRGAARRHWHIDYLLPHVALLGVLVRQDPARLECVWAGALAAQAQAVIPGFGSSDCRCSGHLFHLGAADSAAGWIDWMVEKWKGRWHALPWEMDETLANEASFTRKGSRE